MLGPLNNGLEVNPHSTQLLLPEKFVCKVSEAGVLIQAVVSPNLVH